MVKAQVILVATLLLAGAAFAEKRFMMEPDFQVPKNLSHNAGDGNTVDKTRTLENQGSFGSLNNNGASQSIPTMNRLEFAEQENKRDSLTESKFPGSSKIGIEGVHGPPAVLMNSNGDLRPQPKQRTSEDLALVEEDQNRDPYDTYGKDPAWTHSSFAGESDKSKRASERVFKPIEYEQGGFMINNNAGGGGTVDSWRPYPRLALVDQETAGWVNDNEGVRPKPKLAEEVEAKFRPVSGTFNHFDRRPKLAEEVEAKFRPVSGTFNHFDRKPKWEQENMATGGGSMNNNEPDTWDTNHMIPRPSNKLWLKPKGFMMNNNNNPSGTGVNHMGRPFSRVEEAETKWTSDLQFPDMLMTNRPKRASDSLCCCRLDKNPKKTFTIDCTKFNGAGSCRSGRC